MRFFTSNGGPGLRSPLLTIVTVKFLFGEGNWIRSLYASIIELLLCSPVNSDCEANTVMIQKNLLFL